MKKVRKGNDIAVSWSIVHEEQDFDLTSLDTTLYLINIFGKQEVKDYKKEGNRISWTFHGKDQKNTGKYSLMLVLNEGGINMHTIDACDFVELTSCSCQISEGSDNDNVTTEVIELSSVIDYLVVDDQLDADSANPISNAAVTQAINAVGERILDLITIEAYSSALMQEAFEKYNLATKLNTPISCLVKYNSTDTEYQSVFLVVEEYVDGHKLNFITFNATSYVEVDGSPDPEWQWSPKCRLINGICDSYLIQSNGYVMHLGKGALIIADDELDATSERPISNKALCKALQDIKLFELVESLPAKGEASKVYLVVNKNGPYDNRLIEWIWIDEQWEKLGEFKADVNLSEYAKKGDLATINGKRIDEGGNIEIEGAESSVFEAVYGVTTYDEIAEAYNAKKHIIVWREKKIYNLSYFDNTSATFTALSMTVVSRISCKPIGWVKNPDTALEESNNKTTSLSSASTDTQYPSAKAVYDAIQQSGGGASTDKQGVVSQTLNYNSADNTYSVSNVVRGSIPSFFIDLVTEAGASFNAESGYFSLNGIDNIAYDEMRQIYNCRTGYGVNSLLAVYGRTYTARTNFVAFRGYGNSYSNHEPTTIYTKYLCGKNASITKFALCSEVALCVKAGTGNNFESLGLGGAPLDRSRLEEIIGVLDVTNLTGSNNFFYNGTWQPWLTSFKLKALKASIDLSGMPRLSEATILYMINNEKAASAITIKLHADAKAMADASEAIQSALANHANITLGV